MPKRKIFEKDGFYHVYNRGFQKQQIFFNHKDYERFFLKLEESLNFIKQVKLISYCVLPNHFHLIFQNKEEGLLLSKLMNKLQVAYGNFIKTKYGENLKKGQVFEGRFKAKLLESDDYFQKCLYYVNYNPLKHGIVDKIEDWPYTSIHQLQANQNPDFQKSGFKAPKQQYSNLIKVNYDLENGLEDFFENFEDFEF